MCVYVSLHCCVWSSSCIIKRICIVYIFVFNVLCITSCHGCCNNIPRLLLLLLLLLLSLLLFYKLCLCIIYTIIHMTLKLVSDQRCRHDDRYLEQWHVSCNDRRLSHLWLQPCCAGAEEYIIIHEYIYKMVTSWVYENQSKSTWPNKTGVTNGGHHIII